MTPAENIYRFLLKLYPRQHRQVYGRAIIQHARDLECDARQQGRRHLAVLYLRLIADGLSNAAAEHMQAFRDADPIKPVPWPAVLLAATPGLLLTLSRLGVTRLPDLRWYALMLLLVAPLFLWRLKRHSFPVWALLPAALLIWTLVLHLGISMSSAANRLRIGETQGLFVLLFNLAVIIIFFRILLRDRRLPKAALVPIALMLLGGLLLAIQLSVEFRWRGATLHMYLMAALYGPAEALALVAFGLLAARRHNVLALLVIVGGYGVMFRDSDYLWVTRIRDWPGIPFFLAGMVFLFFVLMPALFLRAKTRLGRALALFVPALLFLAARLVTPLLVLGQAANIYLGDILISANILLALILGWILYSHPARTSPETQPIPNLVPPPSRKPISENRHPNSDI